MNTKKLWMRKRTFVFSMPKKIFNPLELLCDFCSLQYLSDEKIPLKVSLYTLYSYRSLYINNIIQFTVWFSISQQLINNRFVPFFFFFFFSVIADTYCETRIYTHTRKRHRSTFYLKVGDWRTKQKGATKNEIHKRKYKSANWMCVQRRCHYR